MFPASTNGRPSSRGSKRSGKAVDHNEDDLIEAGRAEEARKAADDIQNVQDDLGQPSTTSNITRGSSILFPSQDGPLPGSRVGRSTSYTSLPSAARAQQRVAVHGGDKNTYGSDALDSEVSMMHDGRPTTPRGTITRQTSSGGPVRSATTDSVAQSEINDAGGYVYYGDADQPLSDKTMSPPPVKRSVKRGTVGVRDSSRVNSVHGVLDEPSRGSGLIFPSGVSSATGREDEKAPHADEFSEHEAWYFLRTLVGHEIRWEQGQIHKLASLDIGHDDFEGPRGDGIHEPLDPQKVPVMRYLVKHFLLTMPISQSDPLLSPALLIVSKVRDMTTAQGEPIFWSEGLHPLVQKCHDADFSKPVDQGQASLVTRAFENYLLDALERFVAAGLKLASRKPHRSQEDGSAGGPLGKLDFESRSLSKMGLSFNNNNETESPVIGRSNGRFADGTGTNGFSSREALSNGRVEDELSDTATETNAPRSNAIEHHDMESEDESEHPTRPMSRQTGTTALTGDAQSFVSAPEANSVTGDADEPDYKRSSSGDWMAWVTGSKPNEVNDDTEKLDDARVVDRSKEGTPTPNHGFDSQDTTGYAVPDGRNVPDEVEGTPRPKSRAGSRRSRSASRPRSSASRQSHQDEDDEAGDQTQRLDREDTPSTPKATSYAPLPTQAEPTPSPAACDDTKRKRGSLLFGFLKRNKKNKPQPAIQGSDQAQATSRQLPQGDQAMAIPLAAEREEPSGSVPVDLALVPKAGVEWPFGAPVAFWRGTPFQRLKWGGFETDVVGVRSSLFGKSFIIRVRRPQRLDEYVVRTEDQFRKFFRNMDKMFADAHIRQVPSGAVKGDETIQPPNDPRPLSVMSPSESRFSMLDARSRRGQSVALTETTEKRASSRSKLSTALAAASDAGGPAPTERKRATSLFSRGFRNSSSATITADQNGSSPAQPASRAGSAVNLPTYLSGPIDIKKLPHDAQRRALRNWLRDTLSIRTVGHHRETAAFLLLGSFVPKESDLKDIRQREFVDDARRNARVQVASGAAERVRAVKEARDEVEREIIAGDGFSTISDAIRKVPRVKGLPDRYLKTIEWFRLQLAEVIYDNFVTGPGSNAAFSKLKQLHQAFPYFLVRQAFRLPNANTMAKVLQDILLARPFGSKSLLQKVLAIVLDDDPNQLLREIQVYRNKIGSPAMTEKLDMFVYADRKTKDSIRRYARDQNIELVLCILRGAEEPRLPPIDLQRAIRAGKAYRHYVKKNAAAGGKLPAEDPGARLVIDLQMYLRLVSKDRDANSLREMLADESTADALEVVMQPIVQFIKRVYKVGNGGQAITDLEKFFDQLIIIVEALRARVQEPQKGVRILARLLARHEESLYRFVRDVHTKETIVEEWLQWGWTLSAFLQRGMSEMVDLDALLPNEAEDRAYLFDEVEAITEYHRKKRSREYQNMCRRYAGDVDADDPISVEGDGRGKSRIAPYTDSKPKKPRLEEVPYYVSSFRAQLRSIFSV